MNGRIGRFGCTAAVLAMCTLVSVPVQAKTTTRPKCAMCRNYAKDGSEYCYTHTCHWHGSNGSSCNEGVAGRKYCSKHTCKKSGCDEVVYNNTDVQACRYHYEYFERVQAAGEKYGAKSSSSTSSASSASSSKSVRSTCKYSGCRNYAVSNKKGYCNKHYEQLFEKRDNYYDEDPESYYQDNKSMYKSRSEAYDDWEDEYEED